MLHLRRHHLLHGTRAAQREQLLLWRRHLALEHGQVGLLVLPQLGSPASSDGPAGFWVTLHTQEETPNRQDPHDRLWCHRSAPAKSLSVLALPTPRSFGLIMLEMLLGKFPYPHQENYFRLLSLIMDEEVCALRGTLHGHCMGHCRGTALHRYCISIDIASLTVHSMDTGAERARGYLLERARRVCQFVP